MIQEYTKEYKLLKRILKEDRFIIAFIKKYFSLQPMDMVLDVGGGTGGISTSIQDIKYIHIVDNDMNLKLKNKKIRLINHDVSRFNPRSTYKLIIASHIWGHLFQQRTQKKVFFKLINLLSKGDSLLLFYNSNTGYMKRLLNFSQNNFKDLHYDYFDETLLKEIDAKEFKIVKTKYDFNITTNSFVELARLCWILFIGNSIPLKKAIDIFKPKLKKDLIFPVFNVSQTVVVITRK